MTGRVVTGVQHRLITPPASPLRLVSARGWQLLTLVGFSLVVAGGIAQAMGYL